MLSQSEMESLMASLDVGASGPAASDTWLQASGSRPLADDSVRRVARGDLRELRSVLQRFGQELAVQLAALFRATVDLALSDVEHMPVAEFLGGLENPTCLSLQRSESLLDTVLIELGGTTVFPLLDRLLGGSAAEGTWALRRPLTDMERPLALRIVGVVSRVLEHVWREFGDLRLRPSQFETSPQPILASSPTGDGLACRFDLRVGETYGTLRLCLPVGAWELIETAQGRGARVTGGGSVGNDVRGGATVRSAGQGPELVVLLAQAQLSLEEFQGLSVGDVIVTEKDCREPLVVTIDGEPEFQGAAGVVKGRKAVRLGPACGAPATGEDSREDAAGRGVEGAGPELAGFAGLRE
ncbi:MAG: FliM/FliN family flagellar motor switch protein [Planctomycetes bacterium]|nr:FliM/FliN family flagellar motor switch protein [Planctomycetota bacterium]